MPPPDRCETCRFFDAFEEGHDQGFCRRYAPRPYVGEPPEHEMTHWPLVYDGYWCGEWRSQTSQTTPLLKLNLSARAMNILGDMEVRSVEELAGLSEVDLIRRRKCGEITLGEIKNQMAKFGYRYDQIAGHFVHEHQPRREGGE